MWRALGRADKKMVTQKGKWQPGGYGKPILLQMEAVYPNLKSNKDKSVNIRTPASVLRESSLVMGEKSMLSVLLLEHSLK